MTRLALERYLESSVSKDNEVLDHAGNAVRTHSRDVCLDRPCVIHEPSGHKMRTWPMNFRFDKMALVERLCTHGVGHPDPDSVHYFEMMYERTGLVRYYGMGVHGCDGCCMPSATAERLGLRSTADE